MNDRAERNQPDRPLKMSAFSSRIAGIGETPSGTRPSVREMERPRTESYGELWRRASNRLRPF